MWVNIKTHSKRNLRQWGRFVYIDIFQHINLFTASFSFFITLSIPFASTFLRASTYGILLLIHIGFAHFRQIHFGVLFIYMWHVHMIVLCSHLPLLKYILMYMYKKWSRNFFLTCFIFINYVGWHTEAHKIDVNI